ncbi:MAG: hypothetical protein WCO77_05375 [bacterium]
MRVKNVFYVMISLLCFLSGRILVAAKNADGGIAELQQEMSTTAEASVQAEASAPSAGDVSAEAPKAEAPAAEEVKPEAPKAEAPVIEELSPPAEAAKDDVKSEVVPEKKDESVAVESAKNEPAPVEEKKAEAAPVIEELAPAAPVEEKKAEVAPAIEELAPAAPVEEKKAEAAPAIEELAPPPAAPAKKAEAVIEELPVPGKTGASEVKPQTVPVEVPKGEIPKIETPDEATKQALTDAIKTLGSEERVKVSMTVAQQEEVRRKGREIDGRKAVEEADKAWKNSEYEAASDQYKLAISKLPVIPACMVLRNRALQRLPDCEFEIVHNLVKNGRDLDAVTKGEEFMKARPNPKLKSLVDKVKEDLINRPPKKSDGPEVTRSSTEVLKQMRLGREFMASREYGKSRACFESVLGLDPDNREAMRYLKVLGEREYGNKTAERDATVRKMTANVRDRWNPKYKVIRGQEIQPIKNPPPDEGRQRIENKMKSIVIDEIEFRQANMHDVVDFLNKRSRDCDKSSDDDTKKGVNIILNLGESRAAAPAAGAAGDSANAFDAPEAAPTGAAAGAAGVPEVTFSARYITLHNALKIITSVAGLEWHIDGDVVMIVPPGWDTGTMETRMYPVEPTFIERVKTASAEMPTVTRVGGRENQAMDAGGGTESAVPSDLKAYFENMGVKFPKGSSITYNQSIGKVIVANTDANLVKFEKLLAELNVVPQQVEIEARFVEINETDLYEAGLEWILTDNWEMLMKKNSNPFAPMASNPRIQMNANTSDGGMSKGLRFYGTDANGRQTPVGGGSGSIGGIATFASILTNPDLNMVLHALEQNGNADLLSAPKVTTRSGSEAMIKVVTEYIYPTSFEVNGGQLQSGNNGNQSTANMVQETTVMPQDFATREVGVILNVLPEVSPNGNMINLTMKPQVVTDPIWYQYGSTVRRADGSEQTLNMPQPFFQLRQLETSISVYDGATVVMGGLITESVEKTNDKIPILGDLPLIGALFRSKSEKSVKKNLLIFVTARLVDPGGQLIRQPDSENVTTPAPSVPGALVPTAAMTAPAR